MKALSIIAAVLAFTVLASCNTIRGAGEDVEAGGGAVADAATDVQTEMQRDQAREDAKKAPDEPVANPN